MAPEGRYCKSMQQNRAVIDLAVSINFVRIGFIFSVLIHLYKLMNDAEIIFSYKSINKELLATKVRKYR